MLWNTVPRFFGWVIALCLNYAASYAIQCFTISCFDLVNFTQTVASFDKLCLCILSVTNRHTIVLWWQSVVFLCHWFRGVSGNTVTCSALWNVLLIHFLVWYWLLENQEVFVLQVCCVMLWSSGEVLATVIYNTFYSFQLNSDRFISDFRSTVPHKF